MTEQNTIYQRPVELLQRLIRFDTTNPPGNEAACVGYIDSLLRSHGIQTTIVEQQSGRPNLIARLPGQGKAAPLLFQGHVDVVTTAGQTWAHPPFEGGIHDGFVWGRGATDMKSGVAMMLSAFMRAKAENLSLPGDVVLCILCDEETGSNAGAKYLVDEHAELFGGIQFAIGEGGGASQLVHGKRIYPLTVNEKRACWMRATIRGQAGHGSIPIRGGAMAKVGRMLTALDRTQLPVHITSTVKQTVTVMAAALPAPLTSRFEQLLDPTQTDQALASLGDLERIYRSLFHNTVSPTIIQGGNKINVIPSEITVQLDGRLLPGFTPDDMIRELRPLIGDDVELEVLRHDPGPAEPNMGLFDTLTKILHAADPDGVLVPFLLPGVSDARFFAQLGIQTYGFLAGRMPGDFNPAQYIHAADERIPVDALAFGTEVLWQLLHAF